MSSQTTGNLKLTKPTYGENADVAVINSNMDKIDTGVTAISDGLSDKSKKVILTSSDNTWAKIWEKINAVSSGESVPFYAVSTAFNLWSKGARNNTIVGTLGRIGSNTFLVIGRIGSSENQVFAMRFEGTTASAEGTYTEKDNSASPTDVSYTAGQTLNLSSYSGYGMITSSTKAIYCQFPMLRIIPSGNITINSLTLTVRGPSGYVDEISSKVLVTNGEVVDSNYTVTASRGNSGRNLSLIITKSSALANAVNNCCVSATATVNITVGVS